jgi:hypothetical protein
MGTWLLLLAGFLGGLLIGLTLLFCVIVSRWPR